MKKVPNFWWDFDGKNNVIVECDDRKYPIVAAFSYDPTVGEETPEWFKRIMGEDYDPEVKMGCAATSVEQAEELIGDLNEGRADYRKLAKEYQKGEV